MLQVADMSQIQKARDLLQGAVDLHVHSAPDIVARKFNDLELAKESRSQGLSALTIKSHLGETAARASLAAHNVQGIEVYGGIVLNNSVGGLNPEAVETSLKLGGKIVWMPTLDSMNHRSCIGKRGGISILEEKKHLRPEVKDILRLIGEYEVCLSTGHLSFPEAIVLVEAARREKIRATLLTHPEFWITFFPLEKQRHLLCENLFFERCFYSSTLEKEKNTSFQQSIEWIKNLGSETTIISSDLGQANNPAPAEGLETMIGELLEAGFESNSIQRMVLENPRYILE